MAAAVQSQLLSVDECPEATAYRPYVDYLDGQIEERNIFAYRMRCPGDASACVCTSSAMTEHTSGSLRAEGTRIELAVEAIFATLDV